MQDAATTRRLASVTGAGLAATIFFIALAPAGADAARPQHATAGQGSASGGAQRGHRVGAAHGRRAPAPAPAAAGARAPSTGGGRTGSRGTGGSDTRGNGRTSRFHRSGRAAGGGERTASRGSGATGGTTTIRAAVPNGGCAAHRDARDPGSCQEKGGGNAGDIDPYRGPDASGNQPARGNDCDEGGGNNRGPYPRRTNPNNAGDSDVDGDRGRGNNRCGTAADRPGPGGPGGATGPGGGATGPGGGGPLGLAVAGASTSLAGGEAALTQAPGSDPGDPGRSGDQESAPAKAVRDLAEGKLPFTGLGLGWIALGGALLGGLGLGLRRLPSIA
jgi:hypothetical protein